jgi:MFS family permease
VLGRRRVIFITSGISIIGAALMASSFSMTQFIVARLVIGYFSSHFRPGFLSCGSTASLGPSLIKISRFGTGGYVATVPVWQAEISKATKRGAHVVTDGIFIGAGIAISLWINFGFYFVKGNSVSWRFPLALQILFLMVMIFTMIFPESPRWLIKKGRVPEARQILAALADDESMSSQITDEIRDIETSLALSRPLSPSPDPDRLRV